MIIDYIYLLDNISDEEDGIDGMEQLVASNDYAGLNVGFTLDEGEASAGEEYHIFYAEKAIWRKSLIITFFFKNRQTLLEG